MILVLIRKFLRDIWIPLVVVALLLLAFECLWARVAHRICGEILPSLTEIVKKQAQGPGGGIPTQMFGDPFKMYREIQGILLEGPGKIIQAMVGGESIDLFRALDLMSVGFVHPLAQTILCIWAIGRAAGAITGELDRGTMELLLAQPIPRRSIVLAHFCLDLITIPILCLCMWTGISLGAWLMGMTEDPTSKMYVNPLRFGPALINTGALVFSITGYTLWISSMGRFRGRVLGTAVLVSLLQFLINVIGQIWDALSPLRPFTVFYYYQPQPIILNDTWMSDGEVWFRIGVLLSVGLIGYSLALWRFCKRDLPAPL